MSRWNDKADRLAAFIEALPVMGGRGAFVHREGDLLSMVALKVAKNDGRGGCVIVKWLGGSNPDRKSSLLRIGARFSISLWTRKKLDADDPVSADDLIEGIAEALHGWVDSTPGALVHRLEVTSVALVPEAPGYAVHEILAEIVRI